MFEVKLFRLIKYFNYSEGITRIKKKTFNSFLLRH